MSEMKNFLDFAPRVRPRLHINVGCLMDIPTGSITLGKKGETIVNGGLGPVTGIVGKGNYFKSTLTHYLVLSASDKMREAKLDGTMMLYDTENNVKLDRLEHLALPFKHIPQNPIENPGGNWFVTAKDLILGNVWFDMLEDSLVNRSNEKSAKVVCEAFKDPYENKPLEIVSPSFVTIDSFTEFEGEETYKKLSGDLEDKGTRTAAMEQGMLKTKMSARLPNVSTKANTYFVLTAHVGDKIDIGGPLYGPAPIKDLQHLQGDAHIKGVGSKFFFLTTQCLIVQHAGLLLNQGTKLAEYPKNENDMDKTDLNIIKVKVLRNKSGASGEVFEIILSQRDGILPSLTEFHYCKERDRFGMSGNNVHYAMDLMPDVKLSRTTVRSKLEENPLLRRAVNITAELLQIKYIYPDYVTKGLWCDAKTLYEDIIKLGYDWKELLNTRNYWLPNQYHADLPFLSTFDLLNIRAGKYTPYFISKKETK